MVSMSKSVHDRQICCLNLMIFMKLSASGTLPKKKGHVEATNLNAKYSLLHDEASHACFGFDVANGAHVDHKVIFLALFCLNCFFAVAKKEVLGVVNYDSFIMFLLKMYLLLGQADRKM